MASVRSATPKPRRTDDTTEANLASRSLDHPIGIATLTPASCIVEVTSDRFQRIPFVVNLSSGANSRPTKQRQRRTPALYRVLQQKARDNGRECKETTVHQRPERCANKNRCCGVRLQCSLDIPLSIEFDQPSSDGLWTTRYNARNAFLSLTPNLCVDVFGGLLRHPINS